MIRIAIVDDDKYSIQSCMECIKSMNISNLDIIDCFESGEKFLNEVLVKKEQYDIVILDIDMPETNGFDVAKKINELEDDTIIMFYTAHEQYVFKAYEYQPFRYIRKEFTEEELPFHLKCAIEKIEKQNETYMEIKSDGVNYKIIVQNIEYIEKYENHIEIHLFRGTSYKVRKTLMQIYQLISNTAFIFANRSVLVNMKYIENITLSQILMMSKTEIPISRRKYKNIKQDFSKYIGKIL